MARNRSGGQMGLFGQEKLCILGRREDLCKMSAADTYNAAARSERVSERALFLPSFPTFQCQKLRLVLAHADLRGEFVHAALRPRRRRSVVSRKKFRHDMNNHTVSQSRSVVLQFGRAVSDLASESFPRSCLARPGRDFLGASSCVRSLPER